MIYGIGCDIAKISRFKRWVSNPEMINRFFNEKEMFSGQSASENRLCEYYAARFAAKEAFFKALGTGFIDFSLKDVFVQKDDLGKPNLKTQNKVQEELFKRCTKNCKVHLSLSHEKEYALAYAIIERG